MVPRTRCICSTHAEQVTPEQDGPGQVDPGQLTLQRTFKLSSFALIKEVRGVMHAFVLKLKTGPSFCPDSRYRGK